MNADDNGKDNPNKRDGSPSRQAPCPKKQALDDLNDMRAAAATAAEAEAAAAPTAGGAATSVLRELDPPANVAVDSTTNDTSDSEGEGGESKKYLRPPAAPLHVRVGDSFQAALPPLGEIEEERMAVEDEGPLHEQQEQQEGTDLHQQYSSEGSTSSSTSGTSSTSFSSSSRAAALIAGRVDFEEDGLGSGTQAYR
ncbi:hypothetical protein VYU27_001957 [Nannochloropsis oceanica]